MTGAFFVFGERGQGGQWREKMIGFSQKFLTGAW
jgi:hypothetical protein